MKGQEITVQQLQESINKRLAQFEGRRYEGTEFHDWYIREINKELHEQGILELHPCVWGIRANIVRKEILFHDRIAEVNIGFRRDRRFKNSAGRGLILNMRVVFWKELLPMSLEQARRFLLEQKRDDEVRGRRTEIDACKSVIQTNEEAIARLSAITF